MNEQNLDPNSPHDWNRVGPLIDWAIEQLSDADQTMVLFRFIGRKPIEEIAESLGIATYVARQRIEHATEKLVETLANVGIVITFARLTSAMTQHAAPPAPVNLREKITAAALNSVPLGVAKLPLRDQSLFRS